MNETNVFERGREERVQGNMKRGRLLGMNWWKKIILIEVRVSMMLQAETSGDNAVERPQLTGNKALPLR